ncbi:MAG: hypothetical protein DMD74_06240 [Gemmatimonadetes bacterium]|nr:MAG: hypothetical protein DMD74_06240 [Gemmatimonadota bacterium]
MKDMTTGPMTPFDHRPDPRLGEALRAALEPGDQAAFVARVVAAAARPARTLDVLATWARRGLAAAMAAAAIAGFLVGRGGQAATIPEDTLAPTSAGAASIAFVTAARPPDASVVFTTLVNGSR